MRTGLLPTETEKQANKNTQTKTLNLNSNIFVKGGNTKVFSAFMMQSGVITLII